MAIDTKAEFEKLLKVMGELNDGSISSKEANKIANEAGKKIKILNDQLKEAIKLHKRK